MYGLSLSKNVSGVSVGAELSYRQNMPLVSDAVSVVPAALVPGVPGSIATTAVPGNYDAPGARGSTWHGLVNGTYVVPQTPLFDTASIASELTWMYLDKITQNAAVYKGRDGYVGVDKPTSTYWGLGINFTPTWYQVLAGVDLSMPVTWSQGISGNAATTFGGNKGTGTWSLGLGATDPADLPRQPVLHRLFRQVRHRTDRCGHRLQRQQRGGIRPRLGVAHLQDHVLRSNTMIFNKSWLALAARHLHHRLRRRSGPASRPMKLSNWAPRSPPSAPRRPATRTAPFPPGPAA